MLLKDFYKVTSLENTADSKYSAVIFINAEHDIFKGHFPDKPTMPGVCMLQIIKELTEQITGSSLFLQTLSTVKFTALINPFETPELLLELDITATEDNLVKVKNASYFGETLALKLSSVYRKKE
ncbi:3-hydroxyacyl-ACP dehydratase [Flavobacterium granuli]|uniref:3-hydroxyacyl-[acyl-carrier-protein] dehydratase n=1 Tax=Flavobacterium granuli TaxID=280093 RepID=A0ABU1RXK5_9FLAO|nr:3-hydroxyacyl-ACP dehydratase [Flavobacterium granuli]MDR6843387.1 3-hydroxyacyl-[acyl-carrier-protein] dehydratase [Flavobacterium granuli]